jgi:uncharacterized protein (TIGR03437 family)
MTWLPANSAALILFLTAALPARGAIEVLAVTSSANFAQGLTQPGSLASVFCTGLQNLSGLVAAEGYPLPRELAGVTVTVNGVEAPILAVANIGGGSYQQINIQIPWEAKAPLIFEVRQEGAAARFTPPVNNGWGIFFVDSSGNAIAQHASDYRLVTQSDPARSGEWVVVYATNLGPVENHPADGYPADLNLLAPVVPDDSPYLDYYGLVSGSFGSYQATHIQSNYIGMAPGTMAAQVNLLVPDTVQAPGDLVFQLIKVYHCGFFFTPGCGRGFTTVAASMPAKIPVTK